MIDFLVVSAVLIFVSLIIALLSGWLLSKLPKGLKVPTFTLVLVLLFTPSLAPGNIGGLPLPFGFMITYSLVGGEPGEIVELVTRYWKWHLPAFAITGLIAYLISWGLFRSRRRTETE